MKNILHYVGIMNRGGMETFLMNIYRELDRDEFQFHFIVHGNAKGDYDEEIKSLGGRIIHFPHFRKNPLRYRKTWDNFWENEKTNYHAFHYHTNSLANISAINMARKNGFNNIIVHAHSSYANKGKYIQKLHDYIHKNNQKQLNNIKKVAVSKKAGNWLYGEFNEFEIIPNGIPYDIFLFDSNLRIEMKKRLNLEQDYVIGHVGNFLKVKNHDFILNVFYEIQKIIPNSKLILIGDGLLKNNVEKKINSLNIDKKVILLGSIPNVNDYLNIFDLFLFPSFYEGLPLATVEAQINQVPIIVSQNITKEINISKKTHFLNISQNDVSKWVSTSLSLLLNEERFNIMGIKDTFNLDHTINRLINIYKTF